MIDIDEMEKLNIGSIVKCSGCGNEVLAVDGKIKLIYRNGKIRDVNILEYMEGLIIKCCDKPNYGYKN